MNPAQPPSKVKIKTSERNTYFLKFLSYSIAFQKVLKTWTMKFVKVLVLTSQYMHHTGTYVGRYAGFILEMEGGRGEWDERMQTF